MGGEGGEGKERKKERKVMRRETLELIQVKIVSHFEHYFVMLRHSFPIFFPTRFVQVQPDDTG